MAPLRAAAALSLLAASAPPPPFRAATKNHPVAAVAEAALVPPPAAFRPLPGSAPFPAAPPRRRSARPSSSSSSSSSSALRMNFLSDMLKGAFENDPNLSSDRAAGQLEGPGIDEGRTRDDLTDVQRRFLSSAQGRPRSSASAAADAAGGRGGGGAPVDPSLLAGTRWVLDLYLAGIPERDPSNDLYGRRVNISNRDRSASPGMGMMADLLPSEPTVSVEVALLEGGTCRAAPSAFTSGEIDGRWRLSDDGRTLRLSLDAAGYKRTVRTKGTIQKVFWSDADEVTSKTSTAYSVPPGYVYADVPVGYGLPGRLVMRGQGTLAVEKTEGLLGAGSRMVPCGKFEGRMKVEGEEKEKEKGGKAEAKAEAEATDGGKRGGTL